MSDESLELEAKFAVADADRQRLASMEAVGGFVVVGRRMLDQDDLYFDTVNADLAALGSTLRVRRNQKGAFMTFKGKRAEAASKDEAHLASRQEDEVPLDEDFVKRVSPESPLPEDAMISPLIRARELINDEPLMPAARLRNARLVIDLANDDGQSVELSLDRCVATRLSDGRVVEFGEVELEAKSVDREMLLRLADDLREYAPSLTPSRITKLERALT